MVKECEFNEFRLIIGPSRFVGVVVIVKCGCDG